MTPDINRDIELSFCRAAANAAEREDMIRPQKTIYVARCIVFPMKTIAIMAVLLVMGLAMGSTLDDPNKLKINLANGPIPAVIVAWQDNDTGQWIICYTDTYTGQDVKMFMANETGWARIT